MTTKHDDNNDDDCQYPLEDCTCEASTQKQELPSLKCPCKCGCVRNTVQELGDHIWRYHRTLSDSIKIAEALWNKEEK